MPIIITCKVGREGDGTIVVRRGWVGKFTPVIHRKPRKLQGENNDIFTESI